MTDFSLYKVDLDTVRPNPNDNTKNLRGDAPRTAFTKYNDLLNVLGSSTNNPSPNEPINPVPYMRWYDTSVNPPVDRIRNAANTAWTVLTYPTPDSVKKSGDVMFGPLVAPSIAAVRSPSLSINIGDNGGWWKVGRLDTSKQGGSATLRVGGTTSYVGSGLPFASNGMLTTVLLRIDNDSVVRGSFYSVGASTNNTVQLVRINTDGVVYLNVSPFFTLDVYLDSGSWLPQALEYVGYDIPASSHAADPIYGLKLGNVNALTLTQSVMTAGVNFDSLNVVGSIDNSYDLGSPGRAYRTVYARTGTINTSDATLKCDFRKLTNDEINAAIEIASVIDVYRWIESVETKGEEAREHIGPTVQAVISIMVSHNLDPFNYGFICHDKWDEKIIEHPPNPQALEPKEAYTEVVCEAGERYAFRYSELSMFVSAGLAAKQGLLEARLASIEAMLQE